MRGKQKLVILALLLAVALFSATLFLGNQNIAVLNPAGEVAAKERDLIVFTSLLSLIIVVPVFAMLFIFAWKYREGNSHKVKYTPEWDHHRGLEFIWWAVPLFTITILAVVTWKSSHDLDPFKPLNSTVKPVKIQVVALQWKWLFIYPEQDIATVNFVQFPVNTPLNFEITADAPMNSFWIPKLGGQIYAMNGMSTKLHLMANEEGNYPGVSANISGEGFSGMNFTAKASSNTDFDQWLQLVKQSRNHLDLDEYNKLAKPSKNTAPIYYSSKESDLYNTIVMKYMAPGTSHNHNTAESY